MNWDIFQIKVWQISKTQTVTKSNNSICVKTQQLKLWQTSKTQIIFKRTICDESLLLRTTWHLDNKWQAFAILQCLSLRHMFNYFYLIFTKGWNSLVGSHYQWSCPCQTSKFTSCDELNYVHKFLRFSKTKAFVEQPQLHKVC